MRDGNFGARVRWTEVAKGLLELVTIVAASVFLCKDRRAWRLGDCGKIDCRSSL